MKQLLKIRLEDFFMKLFTDPFNKKTCYKFLVPTAAYIVFEIVMSRLK